MTVKRFNAEKLDEVSLKRLSGLSKLARGDILKMTTLAGCGHPGGSMSSIDFYLVLYSYANVDPKNPDDPDRDRIVISHGHTSPRSEEHTSELQSRLHLVCRLLPE